MGYRSDVGIAVGFKSKDDCDAFIMAYKMKNPEFWDYMISNRWSRPSNTILTVTYESVKWSDLYDDVKELYKMLLFVTETFVAGWSLLRIGEEQDDIEYEQGHSDEEGFDEIMMELNEYLGLFRSIDIDLSGSTL